MAPNSRRKKPEILEKNQLRIEKIQTKKRQRREENEHKRLSRNETNEKVDKNEDDVAEEEGEEEEDDNEKRNNNNVTKQQQQQQQQQQQCVQAEPIMCARKDGMYFLLAYGTKVAAFSIDKDRTGWFLTTKDDASTGDESGGFKLRKIEKEQAKEATLEDFDDEVTIIKDATDKIRTMAFSDCGEYFAVAGDDKRVRIYALVKKKKTEEQLRKEEEKKLKPNYELLLPYMYQECLYYAAPLNVRVANKKVTSVAFTSDSKHVVYGDKYGDVRVCEVLPPPQAEKQQQQKEEHTENNNNNNNNTSNNRKKTKNGDNDVDGDAETGVFDTLLLGHTGTIITSICVTKPNADKGVEEFVCTADREGKIRVTRMPPANLRSSIEGSGFDIQSFCFGHVGFVSQIRYAFADTIVSGGGDGTLRVWNCLTGQQIAQTVQVSSSPIKDICVLVVNDRDKSLVVMSIHEDSTVYETHLILMSSQETTSKLVNRRHGDRLTVDAVCGVGIDTCRDSRFEVYAAVQEENGKMIAKALYHYPQDVLSELNVSVVEEKANVEGIRASEFFENQY